MRFDASPSTILYLAAVVLFGLAAFGAQLHGVSFVPLGLACTAAGLLLGGSRGRGFHLS